MKHSPQIKNAVKALFLVSKQNQVLEEVRNALIVLSELAENNSYFHVFFQSKNIPTKQKVDILNNLLGELGHPLVNEMVLYLNSSTVVSDLKSIYSLFDRMYREVKNILSIHGIVARQMTESEIESLRSSLNHLFDKDTDLTIDIDPSIIGGIKLRIENTFLDASIQNQLQILRSKLLQI